MAPPTIQHHRPEVTRDRRFKLLDVVIDGNVEGDQTPELVRDRLQQLVSTTFIGPDDK